MRRYILVLFLLTFMSVPVLSAQAFALPFGGVVTLTTPCDEGLSLTVMTFYGPKKIMWLWGELPFLMRIPPHVGQQLLGYIATAPVICTISGVPYDGGLPIIMHGSSI